MKYTFSLLPFCLIFSFCFSQNQTNLPEKPWADIVDINSNHYVPLTKWSKRINVKLEGSYTEEDSIDVERILNKLNTYTETITLGFTKTDDANFKIKFLDTIVTDNSKGKNRIDARLMHGKEGYDNAELYIYKFLNTESENYYGLEARIAKALVGGHLSRYTVNDKISSIFSPFKASETLNKNDIEIIKAVYKSDFEKNLKIAEKQFKDSILKTINNREIAERDRILWWVRNPISIIFLPTLILTFLFIFVVGKIRNKVKSKVKQSWIQFGIIALFALLFADIVVIFSISLYDFLTIPDNYRKFGFVRKDTVLTTIVLSVLLLPFLYLFRFIELKIQKSSKTILTKSILVFLSTGFLPFFCFFGFYFLANFFNELDVSVKQNNYLMLSKFFLFFMSIASIRAIIGYFIFKERNLVLENKLQLSRLRELHVQAELKSLQSQINPHFLYNALNSIAELSHTDANKTEKMALSLSDLFRYSINRQGKQMSTVKDEVEMVQTYLEIEQIRFGDRLEFTIEIDENLENEALPMFLLQPLVENAVKHGISKLETHGVIKLAINKTDKGLLISVYDNGPYFPEGLVSGYGLQSVFDLLRLSYKSHAKLNWHNQPEKKIEIIIDNF